MALSWDGVRWSLNGYRVRDDAVSEWRDEMASAWEVKLRARVVAALDIEDDPEEMGETFSRRKVDRLRREMREEVALAVTDAYTLGRGGYALLDYDDEKEITRLVREQMRYITGFIKEVRAGNLTAPQIEARAGMYAYATTGAFERGKCRQAGFAAPEYPGERCQGLTRCRCYWRVTDYPDRVEGAWITVGDGAVCAPCADNGAKWAPGKFFIEKTV